MIEIKCNENYCSACNISNYYRRKEKLDRIDKFSQLRITLKEFYKCFNSIINNRNKDIFGFLATYKNIKDIDLSFSYLIRFLFEVREKFNLFKFGLDTPQLFFVKVQILSEKFFSDILKLKKEYKKRYREREKELGQKRYKKLVNNVVVNIEMEK